MKKLLALHLAAMMALAPLAPAQAVEQPMSVGPFFGGDAAYRIDQALQRGDQNFNELYARPTPDVPLALGGWFPGESLATSAANTALQATIRKFYYLPRGGVTGRLVISNTGASSNASVGETDAATGVTYNLGIETNVPAPWLATASYAAGAVVSFGLSQYVAQVASSGVQPGVFSAATWATQATPAPRPIACNGNRPCTLGLVTTVTGTTVPAGLLMTDYAPLDVPAGGGWVAVDMYATQPAGGAGVVNTLYTGPISNPLAGEVASYGPAQGDYTTTPVTSGPQVNSSLAPVLIGTPAVAGPTTGIYGDSISAGVQTSGLLYPSGTLTGGSGFVANDVGRICTLSSTNNPSSVVNTNATAQITAVSGGAISAFALVTDGSYSTALSAGPYAFSCPGAAGTGASESAFGTGNAHDNAGPLNTQGYLQRALADNGTPFVAFSRAGDSLAGYQTRDFTRLSYTKATGFSTALIELVINDVFGGASATTALGRAQALALRLRGEGVKKIILLTSGPASTASTDGFLTPGNQTVNGPYNAVRAAYNALVRAVPSWADGYLDPAACMEVTPDVGIFKTDGVTPNLYTADGLHPSQTGHALVELCMAAQIKALETSGAIK